MTAAFGGQVRGRLCRAAPAAYDEARLIALEWLFDNEMRLGHDMEIVPRLRESVARYPSHEHFWRQLMIALCRSGRQADALRVYRELRQWSTQELGLEPSPVAQECERAILTQDVSLFFRFQAGCTPA
ncbi:hypothetical protein GCM10022267_83440 [Lentzea roselyniae]|uniref:Bacterial transcriptional activator domain-containing protein n=1 Tax=Lentzea roselyniae TaxID=531940 RepID=A0ABP7C945_9PSEU